MCAAAPPLRLDDSADLVDLGGQLLGGISDRSAQDAVAPLGLGSALLGMAIDDTPLALVAANLLFETAATQLVRATAAVFPLDVDALVDALPDPTLALTQLP